MRTVLLAALLMGCVSKKKYDELDNMYKARGDEIAALEEERDAANDRADTLERERNALIEDHTTLAATIAEMEKAVEELRARKAAADARIAEFRDLLAKFKALIDSGTLRVKIVNGRMVVEMATDILFASGKAELNPEGRKALLDVAAVLASISDRQFQVEGHTDNVPIKTAKYPSNWELAADRALTVTKTLVEGGVPASSISAASMAEHHPAGANDTPEGQAANRRIEIVVVPDLSALPGFDELQEVVEGPR